MARSSLESFSFVKGKTMKRFLSRTWWLLLIMVWIISHAVSVILSKDQTGCHFELIASSLIILMILWVVLAIGLQKPHGQELLRIHLKKLVTDVDPKVWGESVISSVNVTFLNGSGNLKRVSSESWFVYQKAAIEELPKVLLVSVCRRTGIDCYVWQQFLNYPGGEDCWRISYQTEMKVNLVDRESQYVTVWTKSADSHSPNEERDIAILQFAAKYTSIEHCALDKISAYGIAACDKAQNAFGNEDPIRSKVLIRLKEVLTSGVEAVRDTPGGVGELKVG